MRTRILCLVLLGLLLVPAFGFAAGAEIDPSGQAGTAEGSSVETGPTIAVEGDAATWAGSDGRLADRGEERAVESRSLALRTTVLRWLEALFSPI